MRLGLGLARRGLGRVWPNPSVGCVLVGDGRIVGRGWTQPGGRPHAESEALGRAGSAARGATAYVTLEPCAHHGVTAPCADALAEAGVRRAVVAMGDPDSRVDGAGLERLRGAGIEVVESVCAAEARAVNAGFLSCLTRKRPFVTLKLATTLDGRIATAQGESRWITGAAARSRGHLLRAEHDGVLVGARTAVADDPSLDCRLPGMADRSPVRIVIDGRLRLPISSRLVAAAGGLPLWIVTVGDHAPERRRALLAKGAEVIEIGPGDGGRPDLNATFHALAERGLTRVLVEAGGRLAASLFALGLVDRLVWFRSPRVMGSDGVPATASMSLENLGKIPGFRRLSVVEVGDDLMETYIPLDRPLDRVS